MQDTQTPPEVYSSKQEAPCGPLFQAHSTQVCTCRHKTERVCSFSLLLCLCDVFLVLINSPVCCRILRERSGPRSVSNCKHKCVQDRRVFSSADFNYSNPVIRSVSGHRLSDRKIVPVPFSSLTDLLNIWLTIILDSHQQVIDLTKPRKTSR